MSRSQSRDETGADQRAEVIRGLRDLADFLESHPSVRTPAWVTARNYEPVFSTEPVTAADLRAVGGEIKVKGSEVVAKREFPGEVTLMISGRAEDICVEREVTKSEFVLPEELAPPEPVRELAPADTTAAGW